MLRSLISGFLCCLLVAPVLAPVGGAPINSAYADEFTTVPPGDALYGHLASITKAGWIGDAPTQGTSHSLTRYEVALETAKAIFTVTARHRADPDWAVTAPKTALRALRDLTVALSPELKQLDIDVNATRALFDSLIKAPPANGVTLVNPTSNHSASSATSFGSGSHLPLAGAQEANALTRPQGLMAGNLVTGGLSTTDQAWSLPLSQRLRVNTTIQALAQEANDPLQPATLGARRNTFETPRSSITNKLVTGHSLGTTLDVNHWLSLNAGYNQQTAVPRPFSLREALFANSTQTQSFNSGVDIRLLHSLTLSGNLAKVSSLDGNLVRGTRYGGGLGLTGWKNRLSLSANLSRLVPEDSLALTSTATELNLGLDVTQRLSLNLLYQQMFGIQTQTQVAGGIVINF